MSEAGRPDPLEVWAEQLRAETVSAIASDRVTSAAAAAAAAAGSLGVGTAVTVVATHAVAKAVAASALTVALAGAAAATVTTSALESTGKPSRVLRRNTTWTDAFRASQRR